MFVPEPEGESSETGKKGNWPDRAEKRFGAMALFEVIIGDVRAEVMDVMETDVAGKPLKEPGQFVEGTPFQRRLGIIPF